jgi:RNA polymerase sigma factor (sigma-70 family)
LPLLQMCNSLQLELDSTGSGTYTKVDATGTTAWFLKVLGHERDLRAFLARPLPHPDDVADVVQETYARLLALSPERRDAVRNWRAFLFATAHNVAMDHLRRREVVSLDALPEINATDVVMRGSQERRPDEIVNLTQERLLLSRVIASLPERCRQVLILRKIHGLSHKEIAHRMGIAEHTVEKHVSHGVRLCAARLLEATGTRQTEVYPSCPADGAWRRVSESRGAPQTGWLA